ncbi:hypothetical protein [Bosea sp. BK604]|uniref:hypothetical protein n=1 Tax=Bosea sp. BK604 TaxID=2512180 RepID=UPI001048AD55|nr:hypothetical protein [Bosea sp. BK604]
MKQPANATAFTKTPFRDEPIDRLLHPDRFYERPGDILRDEHLSLAEKRALLSSWASDSCVVESCPALRHPLFATDPVTFDEVMDALLALDRLPRSSVELRSGRNGAGDDKLSA